MWHRDDVPDDDTLTDESRRTGTRDRSPLTWTVAIVVVLLIAGAALFALLDRGSDEPDAGSGDTSGAESTSTTELVAEPSTERCMTPNVEGRSHLPAALALLPSRGGRSAGAPSLRCDLGRGFRWLSEAAVLAPVAPIVAAVGPPIVAVLHDGRGADDRGGSRDRSTAKHSGSASTSWA